MFTRPASGARLALAAAALTAAWSIPPALAGEPIALPCPGCTVVPDDGAPASVDGPPVGFDWSFGLRGGIVRDTDGTHFEAIAAPSLSLSQQTMRGGYSLAGDAELSITDGGAYRIDNASIEAKGDYSLDEATTAGLSGSLETSQDAPDAPGLADNVASAPVVTSGTVSATLTRALGAFAASLRASAARTVHGDTVYADSSTLDNSDQNTTDFSAGARLQVPLTPVLAAFIDGEATSETYDTASSSLLVKLDNRTYTGKVGVTGKWGETLTLEGSIGLARRDFLEGMLTDVTAVIYDASASFHPDETLSVTADLSTSLGAPSADSGGTATITHAASVDASFLVNSWLRLRGSAGVTRSVTEGSADKTSSWNAGVGADYLLNAHTDLTADYTFQQSKTGTDPAEDTQTLMVGVTVHR